MALVVALALHAGPSPDRTAFQRWFTFLVESRFYARKKVPDVVDGKSLVVWAARHALTEHDRRWMKAIELPVFPVIPSVHAATSADALNPHLVSKDIADAVPGDLLMYDRPGVTSQLMVYIGPSQVVPSPKKWVVYMAGERPHKVTVESLTGDPSVEWRPVAENPYFLGVYRLGLLGE